MSDENGAHDECKAPGGACPLHKSQNYKVRAVEIDGEKYVNASDLAGWIGVSGDLEIGRMVLAVDEAPEDIRSQIMAALANINSGVGLSVSIVEGVATQPILPLGDAGGLLIDPRETKESIPDTVPDSWGGV